MILCSGGFSSSDAARVLLLATGSCFNVSSIVDRSRLPLKQSTDRLSFATEGLWYSEYASVASCPAKLRRTWLVSNDNVTGEIALETYD